jgi:hypothetical protein
MIIATKLFAISLAVWLWGVMGKLIINFFQKNEIEKEPVIYFYNGVRFIGLYSAGFFGLFIIVLSILNI